MNFVLALSGIGEVVAKIKLLAPDEGIIFYSTPVHQSAAEVNKICIANRAFTHLCGAEYMVTSPAVAVHYLRIRFELFEADSAFLVFRLIIWDSDVIMGLWFFFRLYLFFRRAGDPIQQVTVTGGTTARTEK